MSKTVSKPTTRVVGPLRRVDQRDELHTQAAMGGLGKQVQERWTSESVDPFRRIFFSGNQDSKFPGACLAGHVGWASEPQANRG